MPRRRVPSVVYDLVFEEQALADIDGIYEYVLDRAGVAIAERYLDRLEASCRGLCAFPDRGTPRSEWRHGLRSIAFERRATIAYEVRGDTVFIVQIFHAGRDPERAFAIN